MSNLEIEDRIGEVVDSSNFRVYIETKNVREPPKLAELVKIPYETTTGDKFTALGLIVGTRTDSKDDRVPIALGLDQKTLEREQPQIFELIRNLCEILLIGSLDNDTYFEICPQVLPSLHSFVYSVTSEEKKEILNQSLVLERILLESSRDSRLDDTLLLFLKDRISSLSEEDQYQFKIQVGKQLALVHPDDPVRLSFLLRRLEKL